MLQTLRYFDIWHWSSALGYTEVLPWAALKGFRAVLTVYYFFLKALNVLMHFSDSKHDGLGLSFHFLCSLKVHVQFHINFSTTCQLINPKPHQKTSPDEWINPGETSFDLSNLEFISHLIIPTTNHSRTIPGDQTISKLLGGKPVGFLPKIWLSDIHTNGQI